ncbi:MAG: leucine-rich repeat domain-containing protein [Lachnospiraceae bacterium]|nr:leucine-rich repeat domain-containing protein [Lachnospiraceae bacterium]
MKKKTVFMTAIPAAVLLTVLCIGGIYTANAKDSGVNITDGVVIDYAGSETEVELPEGVKTIGREAFAGNNRITHITLPSSLRKIDYGAFRGCTSLKSVTIPDSVFEIGDSAFWGCSSLENVSIGSGLYSLGDGAFSDCVKLKHIDLDTANLFFDSDDCTLLTADHKKLCQYLAGGEHYTYTIPGTVEDISRYCFWGCDGLKEIIVPGISVIPEYAFANCRGLENLVFQVPTNEISLGAVQDCSSLKQVTLPFSVKAIHSNAFDGCPSTLYFNCPDFSGGALFAESKGYTTGDMDLYDDTELLAAEQALSNAAKASDKNGSQTGTDTVNVNNGDSQPDNGQSSGNDDGQSAGVVSSSDGSGNGSSDGITYSTDVPEGEILGSSKVVSDRAYVIIDGGLPVNNGNSAPANGGASGTGVAGSTNGIEEYAHYLDQTMIAYDIPEGTESVGDFAFARTSLTQILIPDGVKSVGKGAFYHCDHLSRIKIPSSVTEVGEKAFAYTEWYNNWVKSEPEGEDGEFLIVGDGVLIGYKGGEENPELPESVKTVAPGVFE